MKRYYVLVLFLFVSIRCLQAERLQFKYISGVPCVEFEVTCGDISLRANLLIDLGQIDPVVLHSDFTQMLSEQNSEEVTLICDVFSLSGLKYTSASIDGIDEFSRDNAKLLGEVPVWGILGAGAFDAEIILLDLQNKFLDFGSVEIPSDSPSLSVEQKNNRYIAQIESDIGYKVKTAITTADYEAIFDTDCAALAGSETGDLENCRFGSLELRKYTSIRVRDGYSSEIGIADSMIGNNFWQNFVVYLDRNKSQVVLTNHPKGILSDLNDQMYYNSFVESDYDAISECLDSYPDSRLADEAKQKLLDLAVETGNEDKIDESIKRFVAGHNPKRSAEILINYASRAFDSSDVKTGELFINTARDQISKTNEAPLLRGRIDSYRGWIALGKDDFNAARRSLLNSLFVSPDDVLANYLMGRYHQAKGEYIRAWARYLKAALAAEPSEEAIQALRQLDEISDFKNQFTIEDACDFLDGHILHEDGELADSAKMLKYRGGSLIKSAIEKLQEARK